MIYFDNAATSYPKPNSTFKELYRALKLYTGNPGRSSHKLSVAAAEAIYNTRECIADFLNAPHPEGIVFTYNATYALNLAIKSYITKGSHVIISDIEHNAVVRPLEKMRSDGIIEFDKFNSDVDLNISIGSLIKPNTTCIVSTLQSNVTGKTLPLDKLSQIARECKLILIVDASQMIGHKKIDLKKTPCDILCAPSHKGLFGIQGSGFAVFSDTVRKQSFIEGGSGNESKNPSMPFDLPEGYEAGTLGTPSICALSGGIEFINKIGIEEINNKLDHLTDEMNSRLNNIPRIINNVSSHGILSFNIKGLGSSKVASILDEKNICVRSGLHCAPNAHIKMGTINTGAVRVSLSWFNTVKELDKLYFELKEICKL